MILAYISPGINDEQYCDMQVSRLCTADFSIINYRKEGKMLFTTNPKDRVIERMMTCVPNFRPRGHGMYISRESPNTADRYKDSECSDRLHSAVTLMMREMRNVAFSERLNNYITETEDLMGFRNNNHRTVFKEMAAKLVSDNALLAAVYLLTSDRKLWGDAEGCILKNEICFDDMRCGKYSCGAYVLLCAAKDLYLGTQYVNISDLADSSLVPTEIFALACNAMTIRRFGITVLETGRYDDDITSRTEEQFDDNTGGI